MLVLEKTHPTKLTITGEPEELQQIERMLEFLHKEGTELEREEWIDGDVVQTEILEYLGVPLGALMFKHYRSSRELSQDDLANVLGITGENIKKLETGETLIDPQMAEKLGAFFGVAAETFLKR